MVELDDVLGMIISYSNSKQTTEKDLDSQTSMGQQNPRHQEEIARKMLRISCR